MPQFKAEDVAVDGVVDIDVEADLFFLTPFGFRDDGALVERSVGARSYAQRQADSDDPVECFFHVRSF